MGDNRRFECPCPKGEISLPYFILNEDKSVVFRNVQDQIVIALFVYPEVPENTWIEAFHKSLVSHGYNAQIVQGVKATNHYCEFLEDGDLKLKMMFHHL